MGAWGLDTFENDTACDWLGDFCEGEDLSLVEETFDDVLGDEEDFLDSDPGSCALAACEVLARLQGRSGQADAYTERLDAWVAAHPQKPPAALIHKAMLAIEKVMGEDSELVEIWGETDSFDAWKDIVADLAKRVQG